MNLNGRDEQITHVRLALKEGVGSHNSAKLLVIASYAKLALTELNCDASRVDLAVVKSTRGDLRLCLTQELSPGGHK